MGHETPGNCGNGADLRHAGAHMPTDQVKRWFVREVLPLETILMRFLNRNWRNKTEIEDFRQEVYAQVLAAAELKIPERAKPFVLSTARNLLIDRIRREHIVSIEAVADLDVLGLAADEPGPDRSVIARDVLRKLQAALNRLPPRCREAVILKRIEGLSRREIAQRMDIAEQTVADHVAHGMRVLADTLYDERAGESDA
jgi:RNA polymerase sigma factor (sigma-70 family)